MLETKQVKAATADILKQHSIPDWLSKDLLASLDTPHQERTSQTLAEASTGSNTSSEDSQFKASIRKPYLESTCLLDRQALPGRVFRTA